MANMVLLISFLFLIGLLLKYSCGRLRKSIFTALPMFLFAALLISCSAPPEETDPRPFIEKLESAAPVKILIVGDSIGFGTGASSEKTSWAELMKTELKQTYGSDVLLTNLSMGGCSSICGYARVMELDDGKTYDLAVICYGENDAEEDFELYYESILRALRNRYPGIEIICIQESSQREFTVKMRRIAEIAEHYKCPVVDTITPFSADYDSYVKDGTHPNDAGHRIYADAVLAAVREMVIGRKIEPKDIEPASASVRLFDDFVWFPRESFRKDGQTFTCEVERAIVGNGLADAVGGGNGAVMITDVFDYSGENNIRVLNNDKEIAYREASWSFEFKQRHIPILAADVTLDPGTLSITFENAEQLEEFEGIGFLAAKQENF